MYKQRDHKAEYARRLANAMARGLSRSQARGHAKAGEQPSRGPPKPIEDERLQIALRVLRQEKSFDAAAKAARVSPERLRKHATERGLIEKSGRHWQPKAALPRKVQLFSKGTTQTLIVPDAESASAVGKFMTAVGAFINTNDVSLLAPFIGQAVRDTAGKTHPFETSPNALYRIAAAGERSFEEIYRIVI